MAIFEAESTFSKAHHFGNIQPLVFEDVLILLKVFLLSPTFISWGEPLWGVRFEVTQKIYLAVRLHIYVFMHTNSHKLWFIDYSTIIYLSMIILIDTKKFLDIAECFLMFHASNLRLVLLCWFAVLSCCGWHVLAYVSHFLQHKRLHHDGLFTCFRLAQLFSSVVYGESVFFWSDYDGTQVIRIFLSDNNMGGHLWEILNLINCDSFRHVCFHNVSRKILTEDIAHQTKPHPNEYHNFEPSQVIRMYTPVN